MKQNELFNKCCENIDPKTREEVWKQMDKELGRKENRGNSSKIPSNSQKQTLEQAAAEQWAAMEYVSNTAGESISVQNWCTDDIVNAFKAGAEWMKEQDEDGKALLYVNDHAYKKGFKDGKIEAMLNIELTWQDVKTIVNIADSKLTHTAWDDITYPDEQKYYEEVLKEYNEQKQK